MTGLKREQLAGMGTHYKFYPLEYFLKCQAELGLQNIEVWCARPHFLLDDYGYEDPVAFQKKVESYGLHICAFSPECTVYNYNLCSYEPTAQKHSMGYFKKGIEAAASVKASTMVINCCGGARNEEPQRIFERAVKNLRELSAIAEDNGVVLAVETVRKDDSIIMNTLPELDALLKAVDSPSVQASLDLTVAGLAGESMEAWFQILGDCVRHIRFVDGRPHGRLVWGEGLRPIEDCIKSLNQHHYSGFLSLAINDAKYLDDPYAADQKNMSALEPYLV